MAEASPHFVPRPPIAFRVGVAGKGSLSPDDVDRLRPEVAEVLALIADQVATLSNGNLLYSSNPSQAGQSGLLLLSPLAEGSDRLVAEEALRAGYALHSPIPFSQEDYEKDFPDSVEPFRALFSRAQKLEIDGKRNGLEKESYREVGHFVVRNCDLLIAVWDGNPEANIGGTAEIVRFAINARVPVWWIHATGESPPRFIDDPHKLRKKELVAAGDDATKNLKNYLARAIHLPIISSAEYVGIFGYAAKHLSRILGYSDSPLLEYIAEKKPKPGATWQTYDRLLDLTTSSPVEDPVSGAIVRPSSTEDWWNEYYQCANDLSVAYGNRYRSSYVLIAIFAFAGISSGAMGILVSGKNELLVGLVEGTAVLEIVSLILANSLFRWHERWISYRLLAELCRKQGVLSTIGRSLPVSEVVRMATDTVEDNAENALLALPREAWVASYFSAACRAAPLLTGQVKLAKLHALDAAKSLTDTQSSYHTRRRNRNKSASKVIGQLGEICFLLTAVVGLAKVGAGIGGHHTIIMGWATISGACFSAASGAFVGIRAYSEFPLLVQQSSHMLRILHEARAELEKLEIERPLSSRDLGEVMRSLAVSMMQDVTGWMQLFRIKSLEAS
jgi:hypothetical protein